MVRKITEYLKRGIDMIIWYLYQDKHCLHDQSTNPFVEYDECIHEQQRNLHPLHKHEYDLHLTKLYILELFIMIDLSSHLHLHHIKQNHLI